MNQKTILPRGLLFLAVLVFFVYFLAFQIAAHRALWTGVDQAAMEQTLWNTVHGNFMRSTVYPPTGEVLSDFGARTTESRLGTHVQFIQPVLAVLYAVVQRPQTLMVVMCAVAALGAVPVFDIARRRTGSSWVGLAFACIYLLLPVVQTNVAWEIHGTSFAPALMLMGLDALERGKRGGWWVWSLLAMGCREDLPFLVGWAMFVLAPRDRRREAGMMLAVGTALSLLSFLVIIPAFSGGGGTPYLSRFFPPGADVSGAAVLNVLGQADYWAAQLVHFLQYNVLLGLPLLFLYVLDWRSLLAMAPMLVLNSFTWYQAARIPHFSHYSAPIVAWTLVGAIQGFLILETALKRRRPNFRWRGVLLEALLVSVVAAGYLQGYLPWSRGFVWPRPLRSPDVVETVLAEVPQEASLSASIHLAARMAGRETLRFFPDLRDVDWIAVDLWFWGDPYGIGGPVWAALREDAEWQTVVAERGMIVLRRGAGPPAGIEEAFAPLLDITMSDKIADFTRGDVRVTLAAVEVFPLPLGHFVLCTTWDHDGGNWAPQVQALPRPAHYLESYQRVPELTNAPGMFRDCTQLVSDVPGQRFTVRLGVVDSEGASCKVYTEGVPGYHVAESGEALMVEVPAW